MRSFRVRRIRHYTCVPPSHNALRRHSAPPVVALLGLRLPEVPMIEDDGGRLPRGHLTLRDPKQKHDRMATLPSAVTAESREKVVQLGRSVQQLLRQPWRLRTTYVPAPR